MFDAKRRILTTALILAVAATAFEALAVATALPSAVDDIGGLRVYAWAFSGFMLANLVALPAAGQSADRHGAWRPFTLGGLLFVAGLVAAGCAPAMPVFLAARVVQGYGAGAISAAAWVAVARSYPPAARPRMLALLSSAWVVPGIVGPSIAAALTATFGWRSVFLSVIPLAAMALVLGAPALRRIDRPEGAEHADDRRIPALVLALGVAIGLASAEVDAALLGGLLLVTGLSIAAPAFRRLMPAGVLRAAPGLPAAVASSGMISLAFFGAEVFVPLTITNVRGESTWMAGVVLTSATLAWSAGTWVQERIALSRSPRGVARAGALLVAVGVTGIGCSLSTTLPVAVAILAWGVSGLGMGVAYPTASLVAFASASAGREGEASSALQLANCLGIALGTGLCGGVLTLSMSAGYSSVTGIAAADVLAFIAAAIALLAAQGLPSDPSGLADS